MLNGMLGTLNPYNRRLLFMAILCGVILSIRYSYSLSLSDPSILNINRSDGGVSANGISNLLNPHVTQTNKCNKINTDTLTANNDDDGPNNQQCLLEDLELNRNEWVNVVFRSSHFIEGELSLQVSSLKYLQPCDLIKNGHNQYWLKFPTLLYEVDDDEALSSGFKWKTTIRTSWWRMAGTLPCAVVDEMVVSVWKRQHGATTASASDLLLHTKTISVVPSSDNEHNILIPPSMFIESIHWLWVTNETKIFIDGRNSILPLAVSPISVFFTTYAQVRVEFYNPDTDRYCDPLYLNFIASSSILPIYVNLSFGEICDRCHAPHWETDGVQGFSTRAKIVFDDDNVYSKFASYYYSEKFDIVIKKWFTTRLGVEYGDYNSLIHGTPMIIDNMAKASIQVVSSQPEKFNFTLYTATYTIELDSRTYATEVWPRSPPVAVEDRLSEMGISVTARYHAIPFTAQFFRNFGGLQQLKPLMARIQPDGDTGREGYVYLPEDASASDKTSLFYLKDFGHWITSQIQDVKFGENLTIAISNPEGIELTQVIIQGKCVVSYYDTIPLNVTHKSQFPRQRDKMMDPYCGMERSYGKNR